MKLEIKKRVVLTQLSKEITSLLKTELTLPNPNYKEAVKQGRWTGHLKPNLFFFEESETGLIVPRGLFDRIITLAEEHGIDLEIADNRRLLKPAQFEFTGTLMSLQKTAVKKILQHSQGFLRAATGAGKTVMALKIICLRAQPCLVVVPNKALLYQWIEAIGMFLKIKPDAIGMIGDGKNRVGENITVGIINSVVKSATEINRLFGHIIVDEAHRSVSATYQKALKQFDAFYLLALSATPFRRDGLTKLLYFTLGDIVADVETDRLVTAGRIVNAQTQWVKTKFNTELDASRDYTKVITKLTQNFDRNRLICEIVSKHGLYEKSLILSDRKKHCYLLQKLLSQYYNIEAEVLVGGLSLTENMRILNKLKQGGCNHLIGTSQLLGEGFDLPVLELLYLTVPLRFKGKLLQNIGRVLRGAKGKENALIYDFVDSEVGVLKSSALYRVKTYQHAGIKNLKAI